MMKKFLMRFVDIGDDVYNGLGYLLLFPILFYLTDIYKSLFASVIIFTVLLLNIGLSLIFKKFKNIDAISVSILISGGISVVFVNGFAGLVDDIGPICAASVVFSQYIYIKFGNVGGTFINDVKNISMTLVKYYLPVLGMSLVREILSRGRLFKGFSENGILIFNHKFGDYINTVSGVLLVLSILIFVITAFSKKQLQLPPVNNGSLIILSVCFTIASIVVLSVIIVNKIAVLSRLAIIVPFLLCSLFYLFSSTFVGSQSSSHISLFSLMSSLIVILEAENLLGIWVLLVCMYITVLIIGVYIVAFEKNSSYKSVYVPSILLFASAVCYVFQTLLN